MESSQLNQVVLVDDDPDYSHLVEIVLNDSTPTCQLKVLQNGADLLSWLEVYSGKPSLILLDINMPGFDGFDVLRVLKSVDRYKMIPVVMLSVSQQKEDINRSYAIGANAYLVKPTTFGELKRRLEFFNCYWFNMSNIPNPN